MDDEPTISKLPHHEKRPLCTTRLPYRQGRKLTSVKVYTINDESQYLIISKVPDIKIQKEVSLLCAKYGQIEKFSELPDYPHEQFETTFLVKYRFIRNANFAKKFLDSKNFFGGILHVFYAPELESVEETRDKLLNRQRLASIQSSKYRNISLTSFQAKVDDVAVKRVMSKMNYETQPFDAGNSQSSNPSGSSELCNDFRVKIPSSASHSHVSESGCDHQFKDYIFKIDSENLNSCTISDPTPKKEPPSASNSKKKLISTRIKRFKTRRRVSQPSLDSLKCPVKSKRVG